MAKGLKVCDCGLEVGCRTRVCPGCQQRFVSKLRSKTYKKGKPVNWLNLKKGDEVKAIQGHGAHKGIFKVDRLDEFGVHCYQNNAHFYLNMIEREHKNGVIPAHKIEIL